MVSGIQGSDNMVDKISFPSNSNELVSYFFFLQKNISQLRDWTYVMDVLILGSYTRFSSSIIKCQNNDFPFTPSPSLWTDQLTSSMLAS